MSDVVVVKVGGAEGVAVARACADIASLVSSGERVVVVHGGSADVDRLAARMGVPARELTTRNGVRTRYTDEATLEVVTVALAGAAKPRLVGALVEHGVRAVGLTGIDGGLLRARRTHTLRAVVDGRPTVVRDNHSGMIEEVGAELLWVLLGAGLVPVVSPPALADEGPVNVDADRAAASVAGALGAAALVVLTGAPGLLRDADDPGSRLARYAVPPHGPPPFARDGMARKLAAAAEALRAGVGRVVVAGAGGDRPVRGALAGAGTEIVLGDEAAARVAL